MYRSLCVVVLCAVVAFASPSKRSLSEAKDTSFKDLAAFNSTSLPTEYAGIIDDIKHLPKEFFEKLSKILSDESKTINQLNDEVNAEIKKLTVDQQVRAKRVRDFAVKQMEIVEQMAKNKVPELSPEAQVIMNKIIALERNFNIPLKQMNDETNKLIADAPEKVQQEIGIAMIEVIVKFILHLIYPIVKASGAYNGSIAAFTSGANFGNFASAHLDFNISGSSFDFASFNTSSLPEEYRQIADDLKNLDKSFLERVNKIVDDESKTINQIYNEVSAEIKKLPADQQAGANRVLAFFEKKLHDLEKMVNEKIPDLSKKARGVMNKIMKLAKNYDIPVKQINDKTNKLIEKAPESVQQEIGVAMIEVIVKFGLELILPIIKSSNGSSFSIASPLASAVAAF